MCFVCCFLRALSEYAGSHPFCPRIISGGSMGGGARGRQPPPSAPRPPFCVAPWGPWPYFKLKIANFSCASGANLQNCNILQGARKKCTIFSCFLQLFQKLLILGWLCKICSVFFCALCVYKFVVFMRKNRSKFSPPHDRSLDPPLYHRSAMRDTAHVRACNTLCNTIFIDPVSSVRNKPNAWDVYWPLPVSFH